jgi:hypothetical protein
VPDEKDNKMKDGFTSIQISDEQYTLLTRALRREDTPALKDPQGDVPGSNVFAVVDGASPPPAKDAGSVSVNRPLGTPIV